MSLYDCPVGFGAVGGALKVTFDQSAPPSAVPIRTGDPMSTPFPTFWATSSCPATQQFAELEHARSDSWGLGTLDGRRRGVHVRPPSVVVAISLTVVHVSG